MVASCVDDPTNCLINNNIYNWNRESIQKYIKSFDLSYDSKRIRWSNSFELLVYFVENVINEQGKWSSKISSSRRFTSSISDLHITWYYNKQKTLLFQGTKGTDLKHFLIRECEYVSLSTSYQCPSVNSDMSMLAVKNVCVPEVISNLECSNEEQSLVSDSCTRTTDATLLASNTCYNCENFSTEVENMKISLEILQSKMDALQSLANVQKVCFSDSSMGSFEISRLKEELILEKNKSNQLQGDVDYLKEKVFDLEQILYSLLPSVNKNNKEVNYMPQESTTRLNTHNINLEENYLNADCSVHINNSLDDSCLIVQSTSVNDTNNIAYDVNVCTEGVNYNINNNCYNNKCKINEVEQIEHNTNNKTNKTKTPGDESNDPQCNLNFHLESLPQLSLGNLPLIETFKLDSNRKKKEISLNEGNSTKSQVAHQVNEVAKQLSINTSQSINSNLNLNCVKEVKTHKQVHVKSKNVIQDMSGDQVSDLTRQLPRNNLVNASDSDSDHRRYNIPVRITHRPNNGHLSRRSTRRRKYFFRRGAKRHRPPGWPEFLELVKQITTTV